MHRNLCIPSLGIFIGISLHSPTFAATDCTPDAVKKIISYLQAPLTENAIHRTTIRRDKLSRVGSACEAEISIINSDLKIKQRYKATVSGTEVLAPAALDLMNWIEAASRSDIFFQGKIVCKNGSSNFTKPIEFSIRNIDAAARGATDGSLAIHFSKPRAVDGQVTYQTLLDYDGNLLLGNANVSRGQAQLSFASGTCEARASISKNKPSMSITLPSLGSLYSLDIEYRDESNADKRETRLVRGSQIGGKIIFESGTMIDIRDSTAQVTISDKLSFDLRKGSKSYFVNEDRTCSIRIAPRYSEGDFDFKPELIPPKSGSLVEI